MVLATHHTATMKRNHDVVEDVSGAKVWPTDVEEEKEDEEDEDRDNIDLTVGQLPYALVDAFAGITFAEALQNSSTLYGVRGLAGADASARRLLTHSPLRNSTP